MALKWLSYTWSTKAGCMDWPPPVHLCIPARVSLLMTSAGAYDSYFRAVEVLIPARILYSLVLCCSLVYPLFLACPREDSRMPSVYVIF
jgi:hypothetical protein